MIDLIIDNLYHNSMISITVYNSVCQVESLNKKVNKALEEELRYKDQNTEYSMAKCEKKISNFNKLLDSGRIRSTAEVERKLAQQLRVYSELKKKLYIKLYSKGEFPTGLLPRVEDLLKDIEEPYKLLDKRIKPKLKTYKFVLKETFPPLRYYQKDGTKELDVNHRGIMVMPTGTGKTMCIAKQIWDLGVNTLVITPSKSITQNMVDTLTKHFGKGKVDKLTTKTKVIKKPINIINIQALVKINPSVFKDIDAVFIDEFHHSAADTYRMVNKDHLKNCYYRIGYTATNFRNDGSDIALESVLSKVLYEYTIKQAILDGFLMQPTFDIVQTNVWDEKTYQETYKEAIVNNEERNQIIADIALTDYKDKHVLILVRHVEHGENLLELFKGTDTRFIHGSEKDIDRNKMLEDFRKGKFKRLIGTSVIGEGVDLPIADTLFMAGGGKAKSEIMQNIGRILRLCPGKEEAILVDFTDEGSRWLEEHSLIRDEIYNQYEL